MRKFRRNSQINKTTGTIFLLLLIALGIIGYSYSHWQETINIQSTLNMAEFKILIQDYNTTLTPQMSPNNHTLELTGTITPSQTIWTGIIIKNNGTTPVTITLSITTDNKPVWETYFTHNEYFYGPYESDPPSSVWENSPTLPPTGEQTTPPELPAKNKLVVWQNITLSDTPTEAFTIEITVTYTATFSAWTDTVSVIYTLTYPP
jgi:hypothetical protein